MTQVQNFNRVVNHAIQNKQTFTGEHEGQTYHIERDGNQYRAWIRLPDGSTKGGMTSIAGTPHEAFSDLDF